MARNYMQDITPNPEPEESRPTFHEPPPRSIRSIRPSTTRARLAPRPPEERHDFDLGGHPHPHPMPPKAGRGKRIGIWIAVAVAVLVVGGAGLLLAFDSTTITVIPRTQTVSFDASSPFTAYPEDQAAPGTISYTVMTQAFEDSATVPASGTENAEEQATGKVVVYNESDDMMRLIKNTRFETMDGLIFRIPNSIEVPAKSGATPGSVEVTVFADQTGPSYNVGPFNKLTLPGLKSSELYEKIYAKSAAAFSGGFSGQRPAVSESVLESARAEVRNRLNEKAQELARTAQGAAFSGLAVVNYETLPPTQEGGGSVRINERATVSIPVFPSDRLAQAIGQAVSASAEGQSVSLRFSDGIAAQFAQTASATDLGLQPVVFTLTGRGQIVWNVDSGALSQALAEKDEAAFQTIIGGFPSIEEARARIMPFWKSRFPDAGDITVILEDPPQF
ncbi:MAG: hypothetical protein WA021_04485 [Minisyncoccia bacterium]